MLIPGNFLKTKTREIYLCGKNRENTGIWPQGETLMVVTKEEETVEGYSITFCSFMLPDGSLAWFRFGLPSVDYGVKTANDLFEKVKL